MKISVHVLLREVDQLDEARDGGTSQAAGGLLLSVPHILHRVSLFVRTPLAHIVLPSWTRSLKLTRGLGVDGRRQYLTSGSSSTTAMRFSTLLVAALARPGYLQRTRLRQPQQQSSV